MRVLVTGGAGYVGSHAVRDLLRSGHEVVVLDDLSRGHAAAVPEGLLVRGGVGDRARVAALLRDRRIDAVMHFAAYALVAESVEDPALYHRNNVEGTLSLLDAMEDAGVGRIVFSSTCAVYGTPLRVPIGEDSEKQPESPYGESKLAVEKALEQRAGERGLAYAALRYFNAAGAAAPGDLGEDHEPETHAIPTALRVALGRLEQFPVHGDDYPTPDGTCIRDYVHVEDLADAHRLALDRIEPGRGLCLNLGSGRGASVREILDACRRATGHAIPEVSRPRRPGDPAELVADASRARTALDWEPRRSALDTIVESAWRWHSAHPNGFAR